MALTPSVVSDPDAPTREQIKVLLADDHPLIIAGLRRTLQDIDDIQIVGEAGTAAELMQLLQRRTPDVVVVDLTMPGSTGVDGIERIRSHRPDVRIVVLSASDDRPTIDAALQAGANAYVLKSAHHVDIASVLRNAVSGAVFLAPSGGGTRAAVAAAASGSLPARPSLTARELSILSAIASGMTTSAISRELWISEHTIKFHLTNIYRKLGVANRASAIRYALQHGIV